MTCASTPQPLLSLVGLAFSSMTRGLMDHVRAQGFDDLQLHHFLTVLRFVSQDGARSAQIARDAGITQQAVSLTVGDLERRGYVERVPDPTDGRAQLVRWAPRGLAAAEAVEAWFRTQEDTVRAQVGGAAVDGAVVTLLALLDHQDAR